MCSNKVNPMRSLGVRRRSLILPSRRSLIFGAAGSIVAPAISRAGSMLLLGTGSGGGGAYAGPGDIVTSWLSWWGLRAYSAAYATSLGPCCILVDQAGANSITINVTSAGNLDTTAISTWVSAHSVTSIFISQLYDQKGTNNISQATLAKMPQLILTGSPNSKPVAKGIAGNQLISGNITLPQPIFMSAVYQRNSGATGIEVVLSNNTNLCGIAMPSTANISGLAPGSSLTAPATDNAFHAVQGLINNSSSAIYVDSASAVTGTTGAAAFSNNPVAAFTDGFSRNLLGFWAEGGLGGTDETAHAAAIYAQQHTYWGF